MYSGGKGITAIPHDFPTPGLMSPPHTQSLYLAVGYYHLNYKINTLMPVRPLSEKSPAAKRLCHRRAGSQRTSGNLA